MYDKNNSYLASRQYQNKSPVENTKSTNIQYVKEAYSQNAREFVRKWVTHFPWRNVRNVHKQVVTLNTDSFICYNTYNGINTFKLIWYNNPVIQDDINLVDNNVQPIQIKIKPNQ